MGYNPLKGSVSTSGPIAAKVGADWVKDLDPTTNFGGNGPDWNAMNPLAKPKVPTLPGAPQIPQVDQGAIPDVAAPRAPTQGPARVNDPGTYNPGTINQTAGPQAVALNMAGANEARGFQMSAAQALADRLAGKTPSVAQMQMDEDRQQNVAAAYALGNSQRGYHRPGASYMAADQAAQINAKGARDSAMLRAKEQQDAALGLATVGQGIRQGDMDLEIQAAKFRQEANMEGYKGALQRDISQGSINADAAKAIYQAAAQKGITDAQLEDAYGQRQAVYARMGMDAETANQKAALDVQQLIQMGAVAQGNLTQQRDLAQGKMVYDANVAQKTAIGQGIAGGAQMLTKWATMPGGAEAAGAAGAAGGGTAAIPATAATAGTAAAAAGPAVDSGVDSATTPRTQPTPNLNQDAFAPDTPIMEAPKGYQKPPYVETDIGPNSGVYQDPNAASSGSGTPKSAIQRIGDAVNKAGGDIAHETNQKVVNANTPAPQTDEEARQAAESGTGSAGGSSGSASAGTGSSGSPTTQVGGFQLQGKPPTKSELRDEGFHSSEQYILSQHMNAQQKRAFKIALKKYK